MRRREFLGFLGGAVIAKPLAARAQQALPMRRIATLMTQAAGDQQAIARLKVFVAALAELGWIDGRNLRIDSRFTAEDVEARRRIATELAVLAPDVILAVGSGATGALQRATRTLPIVFVSVPDPVGAGFVDSMARPGGNVTGFTPREYGMSAKWLEMLKQIAPNTTRVVVLRDAAVTAGIGQFGAMQAVAPSLGFELRPVDLRSASEIERGISTFASSANGAMIVTGSALAIAHRELIISLAIRHRLPGVYPERFYAAFGGLISYGADQLDQFRQAAGYVDRILKGEKPADLPVQAPTKYELVINLKTAKALGLNVPPTLLARADEVIE